MKVIHARSVHSVNVLLADHSDSRTIRKRAEHYTRTKDVGTSQLPFPLQLAIQFPRHRIPVGLALTTLLHLVLTGH